MMKRGPALEWHAVSWLYVPSQNATKGPVLTEFVLEDFLPYQLAVLATRLSERFSHRYQDKFGISVSEWRVIAHLSQTEKISIREIYAKVGMDKSKASRAAARLECAGYVSKKVNPRDRRLIELSLTKMGRELVAEIQPLSEEFQREILASLGARDRDCFVSGARKMLDDCRKA